MLKEGLGYHRQLVIGCGGDTCSGTYVTGHQAVSPVYYFQILHELILPIYLRGLVDFKTAGDLFRMSNKRVFWT
jgi:hypothetical protein